MSIDEAKKYIFKRIKEEGFIQTKESLWLTPNGQSATWAFDLKALFLDKDFLQAVATVFWSIYDPSKPIQICGLESASIPLVTTLVLGGEQANGLFIRKSKKKKYDLRDIEGILNEAPIVVVDDIVNFCTSLEKQIKVLKKLHHDVSGFFACVHLQPQGNYFYLNNQYGITHHFLFSLEDFGVPFEPSLARPLSCTEVWQHNVPSEHVFNVSRRNQMYVSENTVYTNSDDGFVRALSPKNGDCYWKTKIQKHVPITLNQPGMLTSNTYLIAGTENGSICLLSKQTGELCSRFSILDHIYGDMTLGLNANHVLVTGRNDGVYAVVLFDVYSGKKLFEFTNKRRVHVAVDYSRALILVTTSGGRVFALSYQSGAIVWVCEVDGAIHDDVVIDEKKGECYMVTQEGVLYQIRLSDGKVLNKKLVSDEPFFFTRPTISGDTILLTALHRTIYCLEKKTLEVKWEYNTKGRIFCRAIVDEGKVIFGNNERVLYVLSHKTGALLGKYVVGDRIVSEVVVRNDSDNQLFLQTIDGAVCCLSLKSGENSLL